MNRRAHTLQLIIYLCGSMVGLAANLAPAYGAVVNDIRMWHAPERSRIVFDIDTAAKFKVFALDAPDRVVVDIADGQLQAEVPRAKATGQFIRQIRTGISADNTLRLVFDIKKPVRYFVRLLEPIDHYPYRLVVDYYHHDYEPQAPPRTEPPPRQRKTEVFVLIDPGHGGDDPGALGHQSQEKALVLAIAKRLKTMLNQQANLRAELTRKGDYYVKLGQRIAIARQQQADLFISLHADGYKSKMVSGSSVYVLSKRGASDEIGAWLANKANASDLLGGVSIADKEPVLAGVLLDLSMTKTISESTKFGRAVVEQLKKIGKMRTQRVEQANFAVLRSPDIPSILVETAYITNPQDEQRLNSTNHQKRLARALVTGIKQYLKTSGNVYSE